MPDTTPIVDVKLFVEAMSVSQGDIIDRMSQAANLVLGRGFAPEYMEAVLRRMQSLHELLLRRPDFGKFPEATLFEAAATCPLIVPPANLVGGDSIQFEELAFQRMLSGGKNPPGINRRA
jgi:hypothetical protein